MEMFAQLLQSCVGQLTFSLLFTFKLSVLPRFFQHGGASLFKGTSLVKASFLKEGWLFLTHYCGLKCVKMQCPQLAQVTWRISNLCRAIVSSVHS